MSSLLWWGWGALSVYKHALLWFYFSTLSLVWGWVHVGLDSCKVASRRSKKMEKHHPLPQNTDKWKINHTHTHTYTQTRITCLWRTSFTWLRWADRGMRAEEAATAAKKSCSDFWRERNGKLLCSEIMRRPRQPRTYDLSLWKRKTRVPLVTRGPDRALNR